MKIIFKGKNLRSLNMETQEWHLHLGRFSPPQPPSFSCQSTSHKARNEITEYFNISKFAFLIRKPFLIKREGLSRWNTSWSLAVFRGKRAPVLALLNALPLPSVTETYAGKLPLANSSDVITYRQRSSSAHRWCLRWNPGSLHPGTEKLVNVTQLSLFLPPQKYRRITAFLLKINK